MNLKHLVRDIAPHSIVEARRRKLRLQRLGLGVREIAPRALENAVANCHYELWPDFLRSEIGWTLIDAGANDGDFIRAVALLATPGAVFAFEPQPACKTNLEAIITATLGGKLIAAAVGAAPGEFQFNCAGNSKMSSLLASQPGIEQSYAEGDYAILERITVPVVRLDDVIPAGADVGLLKLDVQGYELEALRGATRVLNGTRALMVEANYVRHYEEAADFDALHRFLCDAGFRLRGISAPFMGREGPLWADAMYVRRNI